MWSNTDEQLDKAHLMLAEKMFRLGETVRQEIQKGRGSAADDDQESEEEEEEEEEERPARGRADKGKGHIETKETDNHRTAGRRLPAKPSLLPAPCPPLLSSPHPSPPQPVRTHQQEVLVHKQLIPCGICDRKFVPDRLEKHVQVCEKMNTNRKVFNSYLNRMEGTPLARFLKDKSQYPEVNHRQTSSQKQNQGAKGRNPPQTRLPAGPKESSKASDNRVACPHCSRRFAPEPAERHIPKCALVKSRLPPLRHRP
ncbi:zinc finger C2HC domain-containing protein 1B-like [Genypterus blacodes]|uniref:zinc finger C2HC domain-containing protein 1B-like n=1 Tax=Genypterus blacodes TaxID=154954 RepID=UPI003F75A33F